MSELDPRWVVRGGIRVWVGGEFPEPNNVILRDIAADNRPSKRPRGNACEEATGTYAGFMRHRRALEDACEPCQEACRRYSADAMRKRIDNGVKPCPGCGTDIHYRSKTCRRCFHELKILPCGTRAAYRRHLRNKEVPCEECRAAENEYQRAWNASKRGVGNVETSSNICAETGRIGTAPKGDGTPLRGLTSNTPATAKHTGGHMADTDSSPTELSDKRVA